MNRARALLVVLLLAPSLAHAAEVQKSGPEVWPGKFQVGFHPLGWQTGFNGNSVSGYKLTADFSGLIASPEKLSVWLGGGMNYTAGVYGCFGGGTVNGVTFAGDCGHDLQLWVFVMLSLEKIVTKIPLVPFVRMGLGGDVLFYNDTAGAFILRVGGGVHYWLFKFLGLGLETNFTFGPGFYGNGTGFGHIGTAFYGTWDFGLGARFAF
jgi:hypothetical protein